MTEGRGRIGFVSTRLAGTDGVSLEVGKWSQVLTNMGHECFYFAGELEWPSERSYQASEAHFQHPDILSLTADLFDDYVRSSETSEKIDKLKVHLKQHLYAFIKQFGIDLLVVENALTIPMNVPLGLAITELVAETYFPTIAHHHDFAWERERFAVTAADDYLRAAFPPTVRSVQHVVINSFAGHQLSLRAGVTSTLVPNVMDFDSPPPIAPDEYSADVRAVLGLRPHQKLLLQPTRIVPRKRIEQSIELARRLGIDCALVISHAAGDEGLAYPRYVKNYADLMNIPIVLAGDIINHRRLHKPDGTKVYAIGDVYQHADLVTYPSSIEGFGNAFLEAMYFKRPIVMSSYEIFKTDIEPKGFKVIAFDEFIDDECVHQAKKILENPEAAAAMTEHNYAIGRIYYSYRTLETRLKALISDRLHVQKRGGTYGGYRGFQRKKQP